MGTISDTQRRRKVADQLFDDQTARIWELSTGETKVELRGHEHVVEVAIFAPVSSYPALRELAGLITPKDASATAPAQFVATGSRDKTIRIWDSAGQCLKTLVGHDNWVRGLAFSPNGKHLLSVSDDKTMRIWDLKSGRCTKTIDAHQHFCTSVAWARQRSKLASHLLRMEQRRRMGRWQRRGRSMWWLRAVSISLSRCGRRKQCLLSYGGRSLPSC